MIGLRCWFGALTYKLSTFDPQQLISENMNALNMD